MGKHNEFGKQGEALAVAFLLNRGYEICAQNYRYLKAEIDIIARQGETVAIVEVKSRKMGFLEDISTTINAKKRKLLVLAADHYVLEMDLDVEVRFDVITVIQKGTDFEIDHLEDAFYFF
ncbi:YraN family protein [Muricauda sp. CAU 1633]|uniref:YraN family protein n=1 Tax=Allomuricauda sp. CAU 1633 TaxID=2816036 RepID=UPI001A90A3E4|nr:YraN family protein [Muricauda sp. CAU 1633]MBO0323797.1 YraN family protein [Muricauda sp. CAU 1633]